ncbi:MAG: hypothetical protein VZR56_04305 [Treponema sp.]|nr:hypothetical protein [Treponema sp.]
MKKIIAITAMVAAAAGIAMAAEVSAGVRLTTNVFGYDNVNGASALTIKHENEFYHAPIAFSVSGEKAGGTLKLTDHSSDSVVSGKWNIWFAPVDAVKFNVGVWTNTLNQEHIDWYRSSSGIGIDDNANFAVTLTPVEGLSIDAVFAPGSFGGAWFQDKRNVASGKVKAFFEELYYAANAADPDDPTDDEKEACATAWKAAWDNASVSDRNELIDDYLDAVDTDAKVGQLGLMMHYGADFGTVSAMFKGENNFKNLEFGAGYAGSVDPLSFFVNVLGFMGPKYDDADKTTFDKVRVEAYAETTIDALSAKFWVPFEFKANVADGTDAKDKIALGFLARLDYTVGDYTLYVQAGNDTDFIVDGDAFNMGIKPGVKFNVGECEIDAAVDISAKKNFGFSVPVSFKVAF